MTVLFDASAIYNTILLHGEDCYEYFKGNCMVSLTPYELGNIAWKHVARGDLSRDDAVTILITVKKLATLVRVVPLEPEDIESILSLALTKGITFYDASYLHYAAALGFELATDDGKLAGAASPDIIVKTTNSLTLPNPGNDDGHS
jgi:predicted nucleic acid-binding protein